MLKIFENSKVNESIVQKKKIFLKLRKHSDKKLKSPFKKGNQNFGWSYKSSKIHSRNES